MMLSLEDWLGKKCFVLALAEERNTNSGLWKIFSEDLSICIIIFTGTEHQWALFGSIM